MPGCTRGPTILNSSFKDRRGSERKISFTIDPELAEKLNQPATSPELKATEKLRAFLDAAKQQGKPNIVR